MAQAPFHSFMLFFSVFTRKDSNLCSGVHGISILEPKVKIEVLKSVVAVGVPQVKYY